MRVFLLFSFLFCSLTSFGQTRTIHVFVALCDNVNQGIVPVPQKIGNGQDPKNNLYWGAGYGVKTFFKVKTKDWQLVRTIAPKDFHVLERLLFKHVSKDVYMLADAYDGAEIKQSIEHFLRSSNGQIPAQIKEKDKILNFGGGADLLAYVGHDGLMDFNVNITYKESVSKPKDVMILACYSKSYFSPEIEKANANPVLWTTHLMAPEAYTLKAAIDGWMRNESGKQIDERAAQSYHKYQKCGIRGARNLFTTGF
ncbi:hypothetical protein SAMN04487910_3410 [Aquimarina amphilecti]|uniref:Uncharacterized protein n=1 Tax=Aquimarina amphilecti TaxID=1038014 RepID=A0A1H7TGD8_AQUAM|nr:hypothetical protein [Aquimarina amphilecti]SEL83474.1 hypothetical protein SAMN04487910_3410 [Aquimarina amphilecti]